MSVRSTQDAGPDIDSDLGGRRGRKENGQTDEYLMLYINFPPRLLKGCCSTTTFNISALHGA